MKRAVIILAAASAATGGCSRHGAQGNVSGAYPQREAAPRPVPKARPTIDPRSSRAAEELVEGFVRLLNAGRFDAAYMLLGPDAPPRPQFDQRFKGYSNFRVSSGSAGLQDGAAGSIYVSVPLKLSATVQGKPVEEHATAVLRRVNDVPGSTEAQRRWHVERIEWKD